MPSGEDEKERDLSASAATPDPAAESTGTESGPAAQPQPPSGEQFSADAQETLPERAEGEPPADAPEAARSEPASAPVESGPRKILQELDKQAAADQPAATAPEPVDQSGEPRDLATGSSSTEAVSPSPADPEASPSEELPVSQPEPVPGDSTPELNPGSEAGPEENAEELSSAAAASGEEGAETEETPDRLISAAMQQLDALIQQIRSR